MTPVSGLSAACAARQWSISADLDDEDGRSKRKAGIEGGAAYLESFSTTRPRTTGRATYRLRPRETMIAQYKLTETEPPR
jgi:hypothetical protein